MTSLQGKTEPNVAGVEGREIVAPIRSTAVAGEDAPTASANHAVGATTRPLRVCRWTVIIVVAVIPIVDHFYNITCHVHDAVWTRSTWV